MTDDEFERLAALYGFAPSRPLREMLDAAVKAEREKQGMPHEDIIHMAKEAGIGVTKNQDDYSVPVWHLDIEHLARFAAIVRARSKE